MIKIAYIFDDEIFKKHRARFQFIQISVTKIYSVMIFDILLKNKYLQRHIVEIVERFDKN